jgi:hypothetical protein
MEYPAANAFNAVKIKRKIAIPFKILLVFIGFKLTVYIKQQ